MAFSRMRMSSSLLWPRSCISSLSFPALGHETGNTFVAGVRGKTSSGMLKSFSCLRKQPGSNSVIWAGRPWGGVACKSLVVCASDTHPPKSSRVFRQNFFSSFWDYLDGNTVSVGLAFLEVTSKKFYSLHSPSDSFSSMSEDASCSLTFLGPTSVLRGSLQQQPCHVEQVQYLAR